MEQCFAQLRTETGDTSADGLFTIEKVNCLGACALGPIVVLDGVYYHHMTRAKLRGLITSIYKAEKEKISDATNNIAG